MRMRTEFDASRRRLCFAAAVLSALGPTLAKAQAEPGEWTAGEIRKVDKDSSKLTIKHEDIKSLDMPAMTMVFQVRDPAMLDQLKPGDKVRFKAEKSAGALVVTELQPAGR